VPSTRVRTGLSTSPILPGQRHFLHAGERPEPIRDESPRLARSGRANQRKAIRQQALQVGTASTPALRDYQLQARHRKPMAPWTQPASCTSTYLRQPRAQSVSGLDACSSPAALTLVDVTGYRLQCIWNRVIDRGRLVWAKLCGPVGRGVLWLRSCFRKQPKAPMQDPSALPGCPAPTSVASTGKVPLPILGPGVHDVRDFERKSSVRAKIESAFASVNNRPQVPGLQITGTSTRLDYSVSGYVR
jgi:hypothetical protein